MPRPSKKAAAEAKAPAQVAAAPPPHLLQAAVPQQPQGIPMPQLQQALQHQPAPLPVGAPPPVHARVVDNESFLRVRDSVSE